jgi:hypothetical protein
MALQNSESVLISSLESFHVLFMFKDFNLAANICDDNNSP